MTLDELISPEELEMLFYRDLATFHKNHAAGEAYINFICDDVPAPFRDVVGKWVHDDNAAGGFLRCLAYLVQHLKENELARVRRHN